MLFLTSLDIPGNSLYRYVGTWYYKVSEQTVVWVANRDNPINGTNGVLSIENFGNLVLRDQSNNKLIWSTNVSVPGSFVQLMETGNLVLYQGTQDANIISWQSFDYLMDTFLPYMKVGVDLRTGLRWSLTSWKSKDDPGTGDYLFSMVLNGSPQLFLFKNSNALWRTGPYDGIRWSGVPDMNTNFILVPKYVENDDEVSISNGIRDPSIFARMTLNESGTLQMLIWQQSQLSWTSFWSALGDQCDYYGHCGSFSNCNPYTLAGEFECQCLPGYEPKVKSEWNLRNGINGCTRKANEQICGNGSADVGFIKYPSVKVPDTRTAVVNRILGLKECAALCLTNCSCTSYASANISNGGSGCITWYGDLMDMRQFSNGGQDVFIKVTASELAQYLKNLKHPDHKEWIIIIISSCAGLLVLIFAIFLVLRRQKGKRHYVRKLLKFNLSPASVSTYRDSSRTQDINNENRDLFVYELKTIISATGSFAPANKLGEGGFGSVYKGWLDIGKEIAVKRLSKSSGQGIDEFKNEVTLIARLQHKNLVKLLGCCIEKEEKMLVYEYLPNKGLDTLIFDKEKGARLDWKKRFDIILGIARGIVYLHRDSRLKIIHRDLKSSNVLLDANMVPKISDFGMARIFGSDQMEAKTHRVVGTYGYMSPEYAMQGLFSEKSDVFSYGVLLIEIISGKKNNSYFSESTLTLIGHVWELWKEGKALDIVDPAMGDLCDGDHDEVGRCILIGLLCVQEHARDRPTMSKVLSMLCNETLITSASPNKPAFVIEEVNRHHDDIPLGASSNDVTISAIQAR